MRRLGGAVALLVCVTFVPLGAAADPELAADTAATPEKAAAAPEKAKEAPSASAGLAVRDVKVEPAESGPQLVVELTRAPERVREFTLTNPPRLVIDVRGPQPAKAAPLARFPVTGDPVTGVRAAWNGDALRIVADLNRALSHTKVQRDGERVIVDLGGPAEAAAAGPALAATAPTPAPSADAEKPASAPAAPEPQKKAHTKKTAKKVDQTPNIETAHAEGVTPDQATKGIGAEAAAAPSPSEQPGAPEQAPPAPLAAPVPAAQEPEPRRVTLPPDLAPRPGFAGQRISLDLKDADIQNVLRLLADVSGRNIIATDDVKGKVTLHLNDVPWDQALDLVLRTNRLEKSDEGNITRISTVNRLKEEREALRAAQEAQKELEPVRVKYLRVNYARADEALVDKVKGVLTDRGSVTFDDRTNTIVIRDIPRGIEDATDLVRELDVQSPQVLIEANIVEATEDFASALGVQWGYNFTASPQTGNPTGVNFPGTVGVGGSGLGAGTAPPPFGSGTSLPVPFLADFPVPANFGSGFGVGNGGALDLALGSINGAQSLSARLTALEELGKAKVISRPRVITMNNVAATIQSLTILRVKLPSTGTVINTGTGGAAGSASTATEKINTGITLVVTPQISADGYVLMNIFAKSSLPDFTHTVDGIPNEISREANSNVLIPNGETVVLGGIFRTQDQDNESGIPYLRSIPVLGWLFKNLRKTKHHEELLVFLSPKVVANGTTGLPTAKRLWEERKRGG